MSRRFKTILQQDTMDCGPSCLAMIADHYGKSYSIGFLRDKCNISRTGVSLRGINKAAQAIGFETKAVKLNIGYLLEDARLPLIIHWADNHFVVVYRIKNGRIYVADPASGKTKYSVEEFCRKWTNDEDCGFALMLTPAKEFFESEPEKKESYFGIRRIWGYVSDYKRLIVQLALGFILSSAIQLAFPILTEMMIDKGIVAKNVSLLVMILAGQLMLIFSRTIAGFIQNWIVLHIGTIFTVKMIYDFIVKIFCLPFSFFETRQTGDILQRIFDQSRIEQFVTENLFNIIFATFNVVVFSVLIISYSIKIFIIFFVGSALYLAWIAIFLNKRRIVDYERFERSAENQGMIIQLINGAQEIKLNNCQDTKLGSWAKTQKKLFNISIKSLKINQYQQAGAVFINESTNVVILFVAALSVINGSITLGMMLAIQYVIGQLRGPIEMATSYIHTFQEAKISLDRMGYVHEQKNEKNENIQYVEIGNLSSDIEINNLTFSYSGSENKTALDNISISIPRKKTTAIVGMSGSGKTTLLKLLLGFYTPQKGNIAINGHDMRELDIDRWRDLCGTVMQDGYIFSDTIGNNITLSDTVDPEKFETAVRIACVNEFAEELPLKYGTKIGNNGIGLSSGQKQRILIARAIYKSPEVILFDEATNSLDSNNEKVILENLKEFFVDKTAIIVAHRLSTVKNADQIIVLDKGKVVEVGTNAQLIKNKGAYYNLICNQLELGN